MLGKKKSSVSGIITYVFMTLFSLAVLYPFYYLVINSFNAEIVKGYALFTPRSFSVRGYEIIFTSDNLVNAFIISFLRSVLGIITVILFNSLAAFGLRKRELVFRNIYLIFFTIPMFFGGGLIPGYLNFRNLGLIDNFLIYIIPSIFGFFYIIILMTSFNDIPGSIEDAAVIDGAGSFYILFRIFLPLSVPVLATIGLFTGVGQWNSWFDTVYFTRSPQLMTLSAVMYRIIVKSSVSEELNQLLDLNSKDIFESVEAIKLATIVVTVGPIIFIYPFFQRYFIKGIRIGSIKG